MYVVISIFLKIILFRSTNVKYDAAGSIFHLSTGNLRMSCVPFKLPRCYWHFDFTFWHIVGWKDIYLIAPCLELGWGHYRKYWTVERKKLDVRVKTGPRYKGSHCLRNTSILNATMAPTGSWNYVETFVVCVRMCTVVFEWFCVVTMMLAGLCFGFSYGLRFIKSQ